jgi:putative spermidine/putrescine transport system permease protein
LNEKLKPYILLAPVLIILISIFTVGIVLCILQSFGYFPAIGMTNITLDYYEEVLNNKYFIESLIFTLRVSLISSVLSIVFGVIISYLLLKDNKYKKLREAFIRLPIIVPHIVAVLLVYNIFSQSGLLPRILYNIGIIKEQEQFMSMVLDKQGIGIILTYLWKEIPFVVLMVYNIFSNVSDKLEEVAINLGASKIQAFFYVLLPLSMPTILSSFIIIFAFSFGSFEVPYLIGPTTPKLLPVEAYIQYSSTNLAQRPYAMVINIILTLICFLLLMLYNKVFEKIYKYKL